MSTLWISGAGGFVGAKLVERATQSGRFDPIYALDLVIPAARDDAAVRWAPLDIGDGEAVQALARRAPPDVILNPAALSSVEACEARRDEAWRANVAGPRHLAQVARGRGAHLVQVSSDYVFPGDDAQPGPYAEDDPPRPINHYGATKRAGEEAVAQTCGGETPYTIVRTALVYGPSGRRDFVTQVVRELVAGRRVRALDQVNTPTLVDDLADALCWIAEHQTGGVYHVAGPDVIGRYEWALAIAERFGLDATQIERVRLEAPNRTTPRPRLSGLRCERWRAEVGQGAPQPCGILAGLSAIASQYSSTTSKRDV
jgi:dTDP-4-dehydrorhamnose reductase